MVKIENGRIIIDLPIAKEPRDSSSGKTLLLATLNGEPGLDYDGKSVRINLNVTVKK